MPSDQETEQQEPNQVNIKGQDQAIGQKRKAKNNGQERKTKQRRGRSDDDDFRHRNDLASVEYIFENGLRKVKPYFFQYRAYAKGRWLQRPLLDFFSEEFQDRDKEYYRHAIENGIITVNDQPATVDQIVKNNDIIGHKVHRHEPPVTAEDIQIVHQQDDLVVINKPGGIPIHPAGRYRHNTLIHVLRRKLNVDTLHPVNRLDRPTSGLIVLGLSVDRARELERAMSAGQIQKEYVCRVEGEFPEGEVVCEAPIKTISYKLSINYVHNEGKQCKTVFQRISYDGKTSVVRCQPKTGRTHQIRVHLRYLGYPIANDHIYGTDTAWTHLLPKGEALDDTQSEALIKKVQEASPYPAGLWQQDKAAVTMATCPDCGLELSPDPDARGMVIWLHAWRYAGDGWAYETEMPAWASENFAITTNGERDSTAPAPAPAGSAAAAADADTTASA